MAGHHALFAILILANILIVSCEKEWWQKTVIYQIYPRSFKDSNGDGIGDLNGITESLDHIKDAGIGAIWLSPIYKSPMYDFGYDIADFKDIQPEYGTMADFENLVTTAKSMGINVILDFVPNHSSNESVWFTLSVNRTEGYEDYYVWADGKPDPDNPDKTLPPSNWISVFRKSAWEYNPIRKQYYLHQFVIGQPDLNYRNPKVVEEMKNVIRFWLDKGVMGIRIDAIPNLFEVNPSDFNGIYPDEPRSNNMEANEEDYEYLNHIYSKNQKETYDMINQWREIADEYKAKDGIPRVMLSEAYEDIKLTMDYYGNATHEGSHLPFNFQLIVNVNDVSDARDIKFAIDKWLTYMPVGKTANWVLGNHDNKRMASRYGIDRADAMNMISLLLPGVAVTYQGEELAMTDGEISWEDTKDPAACNTDDPINYVKVSRDPARTPFHWNDSEFAGFTTGNKTWLPVASNYQQVNLKVQKAAAKSHYKFYQDLVALRKTKTVSEGDTDIKVLSNNVLAILRSLPNEPSVIAICNIGDASETVDLTVFRNLPDYLTVNTSSINSTFIKGAQVETSKLILPPKDAVVFNNSNLIVSSNIIMILSVIIKLFI